MLIKILNGSLTYNLSPKAFTRKRPPSKPYYSIKTLKEHVTTRNHITKPRVATLFVKHKRRNTFLTLSRHVKNKATNKFGKLTKKPQFLVFQAMSIGHLRLYKGRGKSSSVAFKGLALRMIKRALKFRFSIIDIVYITELKRLYLPISLACAEKGVVVRMVKRNILRPHGYVRKPKARRT